MSFRTSVTGFMASLLLLSGAVLLPAQPALAAAEAVAMVTDLQGRARLVEDGRQRPLALLEYLRPGHEVRLAKGASLTLIYFQSGTQYAAAGEGSVRIAAAKPEAAGGAKLTASETRQAALAASARKDVVQGALVMKTSPTPVALLSPAEGKLLDARLTFRWESKRVKPPYRFTLLEEKGARLVETQVSGTSYALPAEVKLREGTRYVWRVEGQAGTASQGSEAGFEIATAAERDKLSQARPAAGAAFAERVLYATILDGMGFREEARGQWRKLAAERPNDIRLRVRANKEH